VERLQVCHLFEDGSESQQLIFHEKRHNVSELHLGFFAIGEARYSKGLPKTVLKGDLMNRKKWLWALAFVCSTISLGALWTAKNASAKSDSPFASTFP